MNLTVPQITNLISLATIGLQIACVAMIIIALTPKHFGKIKSFISKNILVILFLFVLSAVVGSLFYSELAGLVPCRLCWYQRILMYPQIILLAIAYWKNDRSILDYILGLSILGLVLGIYHFYIQFGGVELVTPCTIGGSCADKPFVSYGYITIPMMSLTIFMAIIVTSLFAKKHK